MSEKIATAAPAPAAKIAVPSEVVDLVRGSLLPKNSVGIASVEFYRAALDAAGVDPESLSFAESVEVTRRLYGPSADFRRAKADAAKAEREAKAAEAKAKRDAERAKRIAEEIAKAKARLAALESGS